MTGFLSQALFGDGQLHAPTGWTDKEVFLYLLGSVGGTLAVVVSVAWGLVKLLTNRASRRAARLESDNRALSRKVEELGDDTGMDELRHRLEDTTKEIGHMQATLT